MMQARGALLVLAIVAALLGAPRSVTAASNILTPLAASPSSGTVTTAFTLRVAYDGRFAALAVTAGVAGRTLPMALVSGSLSTGTWSVTTLLPAGSWTVTYRATTAQGSAPTATGSSLSVAGAVTATPAPPPPSGGGPPIDDEGTGVDPIASPGSPPPAAPASQTPTTAGMTPEPAIASPGSSPHGSVPGTGVHGPPVGGPTTGGSGAAPGSAAAYPSTGAAGAPTEGGTDDDPGDGRAAPSSGTSSNEPDPSALDPDRLVTDVLATGLVAVAGIAVGGTAFLLVTRRRSPRRIVVEGSVVPSPAPAPEPDRTAELLDRRALRRARMVLDEDLIVASLVAEPPDSSDGQAAAPAAGTRPRRRRA
jgi:hypothetical protein